MHINFDNVDFTETLSIGFKGRHQLPLITVIREYRDEDGTHLGADMLWSSSRPLRFIRRLFRRISIAH